MLCIAVTWPVTLNQIKPRRMAVLMGHYLARNGSTLATQVQVPWWRQCLYVAPGLAGWHIVLISLVNLLHGYLYINAARTHDQVKIYYR